MPQRLIYRDYRPGHRGEFTTEETYNRSRAQGIPCHVHGEYIDIGVQPSISALDELAEFENYDDLEEYEFHGTGDTGGEGE